MNYEVTKGEKVYPLWKARPVRIEQESLPSRQERRSTSHRESLTMQEIASLQQRRTITIDK